MRLNWIPKKDWDKMDGFTKLYFGYMQFAIYALTVITILKLIL